jgi:hypothetical protein
MSIIFHIMKEEYDRLQEALRVYSQRIAEQPRGAPRIRHIGHRDYLYLKKRQGQKVVEKYVGPSDSPQAQTVLAQVEKRRKAEKSLRKVRHDLKDVEKVLRGKV